MSENNPYQAPAAWLSTLSLIMGRMKFNAKVGHFGAALLVFALWPMIGAAQTITVDKPYIPKFARVVTSPVLLNTEICGKPEYPKNSARNEEEGTVQVEVIVASNGFFFPVRVIKSSGYRDLDRATVVAFNGCKFRPGMIDGKAVQTVTLLNFQWKLQ